MRPDSIDLRERVAAAVDQHEGSLREIARRFRVRLPFLTRWLRRRRHTGSLAPQPPGGGHPPAGEETDLERLSPWVPEQPDATRAELRQHLGGPGRNTAIGRALLKRNLSRQKKVWQAPERDPPKVPAPRPAFPKKLATRDPERRVFGDERGATTTRTRPSGRVPKGERGSGAVPGRWPSATRSAALRWSGVGASWAFAGARDPAAFRTSVQNRRVPPVRPGAGVRWDKLKPPPDAEGRQAVEQAGVPLASWPPYSPDLTPIEKRWSKVKEPLRAVAARAIGALDEAMGDALREVNLQDILGWFKSCGLCTTQS